MAVGEWGLVAEGIAARRLNLDDVRAEIAKKSRGELRRRPAEIKDSEMPERRRVGFVLVSHDSCSPTFLPVRRL